MPDPSRPTDATDRAARAPEAPSGSVPVPVPADPNAPTLSVGADPDFAETADPDAPADRTHDLNELLAPAQQPDELGRLGHYRVLRVLGRGGMGIVFEAEDERLKRRVALKVMLPSAASNPAARKRFVREAETAARVEHDNIVPIYDVAEPNGVPFIAMPLLVGEPLDAKLKAGAPLPVPDALTIGRHIAEGLAAAHAAGLIHRDIKPANVWLERGADGGFKRARILDFGLARPVGAGAELTHSGAVMGTPAYMAPEQAQGGPIDHRADLFSLGCTLYQMATGRRPFLGGDTYSVLTALATQTPPLPITVNPAVPPALSTLIEGLLAKNPADRRPATAHAVAEELARIAPHSTVVPFPVPQLAPRPSQVTEALATVTLAPAEPPRAEPAPRPRKWLIAGAALVLIAGAIGVYAATRPAAPAVAIDDPPALLPDEPKRPTRVTAERLVAAGWVVGIINPKENGREFFRAGDALPPEPLLIDWVHPVRRDLGPDALTPLRELTDFAGSIDLDSLPVTEQELARFVAAPGLARLRSLDLARTGLADGAVPHLKAFRELRTLVLRGNPKIGDPALNALAGFGALDQLDVRETGVTRAAVEKLAATRPNLRIEHDGGTILPTATGTPIDLLALIDTKRDTVEGRWKLADGQLVCGGTTFVSLGTERLQVPYAPPAEYDLVMVVRRGGAWKGEAPFAIAPFALTLTGPCRCQVIFDHGIGDKTRNGLQLVGGLSVIANETRTDGDFLARDGTSTVVTCRVRKDGISVLTDGQARFGWKGDARKLTHDDALWKYPDMTRLALAVQYSEYIISTWTVHPVRPGDEPPPSDVEQRRALDWVLANGGSLVVIPEEGITKGKVIAVSPRTKLAAGNYRILKVGLANLSPKLTDETADQLKMLPAVTERLDLSNQSITDAGLAKLCSYPGIAGSVQQLDLGGTRVTAAGLKVLVTLRALVDLDLRTTKVTKGEAEALAKLLPRCKIVYTGGTIPPK